VLLFILYVMMMIIIIIIILCFTEALMVNSSGDGFGPGIPGLQFGIGLGARCGIGYGFGYGVGRGVAHDEKRRYSNAGKHFRGLVNLLTR
jgi:hypothetical protein